MRSTAVAPDAAEAAQGARTGARRRQLLTAAARLMAEHGSPNVSMQAVADEAGVSVGLIYRYFGGKQDLLQAVIVSVLESFAARVTEAIGDEPDPVRRIAAAFAGYCDVIADEREAALLAYRESKSLDPAGRHALMELEIQTAQPLVAAVTDAVDAGLIRAVNVPVFAYQLLMTAHSWALKHWYFGTRIAHADFVADHTALALSAVLRPETRDRYADLLGSLA
ncbi:TetR family transcriptional regulator [Tersicoccus solisilvae]|uniref:TetR family transcriptional regulator n=1 Tax=Tersicoccus solisilvae TaxID=1882339 RepID=A0ABQ1PMJ1_9MICC|nr:TetR/AcrR family transcriptional regulator [Tersicoccus solisilvae]GGC99627.1 TetR family transcriptional regulator [Tersicoccus solisilvae]